MLPVDTVELSKFLIGKLLVSRIGGTRSTARIVEVEAYVTGDPASHAFRGITKRNKVMFGRRGFAYVYRIYGTSWCLNVTSAKPGVGEAVLIRALEPVAGIDAMRARRPSVADRDLLRGPGRLCAALGIDGAVDGLDLCAARSPLALFDDAVALPIGVSTRIGLTKAAERALRYYARGSKWLSGRASLSP
ncbi:MAG TPA: DNA-3-methyladenine glycosylase [Candidatus Baltobacteraceae bacterium]|jgi:DNA-3-methyladenine glycosylase